jgi:hypothetical protein
MRTPALAPRRESCPDRASAPPCAETAHGPRAAKLDEPVLADRRNVASGKAATPPRAPSLRVSDSLSHAIATSDRGCSVVVAVARGWTCETPMQACRRFHPRDWKRGKGVARREQPREPKQSWAPAPRRLDVVDRDSARFAGRPIPSKHNPVLRGHGLYRWSPRRRPPRCARPERSGHLVSAGTRATPFSSL